jgi:Ca-activated chloride channel family protein
MKNNLILFYLLFITSKVFSQGAAIVSIDSASNSFVAFKLAKTITHIDVVNQIATLRTNQKFVNTTSLSSYFKYVYPMPETGSAVKVRWRIDSVWNDAYMVNAPQDSLLINNSGKKSSFLPKNLDSFLGKTPFYFPVNSPLKVGESIEIELTYVQLLPYFSNWVYLHSPSRYNLIQPSVDSARIEVSIQSYRKIDSLYFHNYSGYNYTNAGMSASIYLDVLNNNLSRSFDIDYKLAPDEVGFFGFNNFYPDSIKRCDTLNGFFTLIVEPNSVTYNDIIRKDFILIIDQSGSMGGSKIEQAKEAANFIINRLNPDDRFNIIKFDTDINSFSSGFTDFNNLSKQNALDYISAIKAYGGTNISGSFDLSIPMFRNSPINNAKIIIFFTDGNPTDGITNEKEILSRVHELVKGNVPDINLFTFGIGSDINQSLLSQLATQNNGVAKFLGTENLASSINEFYLTIQSPVLLAPVLKAEPNIVLETYPNPLPNLYKGQQMIISGRYSKPGPVKFTLSGSAFGKPVSYQYEMALTDSLFEKFSFLPKIWAKGKNENLLGKYYSFEKTSTEAINIKTRIIETSLCWGIVTPFTSFQGGSGGNILSVHEPLLNKPSKFFTLYPNPVHSRIWIKVNNTNTFPTKVYIKIYSLEGILLLSWDEEIDDHKSSFEIDLEKLKLSKGLYICNVNYLNNFESVRFEFY